MKKKYLYVLWFFMLVGCATPPAIEKEQLRFFPDDADIYVQINVGSFRKLGKDISKMLPKSSKKSVKTGVNFTGRVSLYYQNDIFMAQALGSYPQKMVLNKLAKNPNEFIRINENTFMTQNPVMAFPGKIPTPMSIHVPQNNIMYASNALEVELARIQKASKPSLPIRVEQALMESNNAVIYFPHFSTFLQSIQLSDPLPIPLEGLLLTVTTKGSKYFVEYFAFFNDNPIDQRRLVAQSRFIVASLSNNKLLENMTFSEEADGVYVHFSVKHKEIVSLMKRLSVQQNTIK